MRCPYCGVNYTDGERQCPICGKRAPLNAPKKKKTIDFGISRESKPIETHPMRFRTFPNANRKRNRIQSPLGSVPPAANIPTAIRLNPRRKTAAA